MKSDWIDYASIQSHETKYHGALFRSRLEAKWVAFFDLCGWDWIYEPYTISGWLVDFLIRGKDTDVICEVKPISRRDEKLESEISRRMMKKVKMEPLLLGLAPYPSEAMFDCAAIGWLGEHINIAENDYDIDFDVGVILKISGSKYPFGLIHGTGSYRDRISGLYDGDGLLIPVDYPVIQEIWNEACAKVRYEPEAR